MENLNQVKIQDKSGKLLTVEEQILDPIKTMARNMLGETAKIPRTDRCFAPKLKNNTYETTGIRQEKVF